MIPDSYRVTLLVANEDRGGKLPPTGSGSVTDFIHMHLNGDRGAKWDHPPEYELIEVAAPGTWSRVPGAPMFELDEERARMLWTADNVEGVELDTIDRWEDSPDAIDGAVTAALDYEAITSARPGAAALGVYPQSCGDQQPVLAVTPGDGGPMLLDPHDWDWPPEDAELDPVSFTVAVLVRVVERANQMIAENERRGAERPQLDHIYNGAAARLGPDDEGTVFEHDTADHYEGISGAFRVLCWLQDGRAVVGNGEQPETVWLTQSAPERAA